MLYRYSFGIKKKQKSLEHLHHTSNECVHMNKMRQVFCSNRKKRIVIFLHFFFWGGGAVEQKPSASSSHAFFNHSMHSNQAVNWSLLQNLKR